MTPINPSPEAIAVIDLGGQYCHMIGRRLRDIGVQADILDHDSTPERLRDYAGIILSGGPQSVYQDDAPTVDPGLLAIDKPILGICYGHQLLARMLDCEVEPGSPEYGKATLHLKDGSAALFDGTPQSQTVWMSHGDSVRKLAGRLQTLAETDSCEIAAFGDPERKLFGLQFHPEVGHTLYGKRLLENFIRRICRIERQEQPRDRIARLIADIRTRVAKRSVFFFVSGGVDSTVAFSLCARALPRDRVIGVYVDTGLMRKDETEELRALLDAAGLGDRLIVRNEAKRFLDALQCESDPEQKRKIIGRAFVDVQSAVMHEQGFDHGDWLLGQGTIYPDTVESGGSSASTALIKTHHNRCEEIQQLIAAGRVIEPLTEFYKDEVRALGRELGLDPRLTARWPFPGPGLAIRCLCTTQERPVGPVALPADYPQYQAIHIPIRSVGVQGDARTFREVVALAGPLDYEALGAISTLLCNTRRAYNRAIVRVAGAPELGAGTVRRKSLTAERIALLRECDAIVRRAMEAAVLTDAVWQFPTVLIPVSFNGGESIVLRPINSEDGMTANFAHLPLDVLRAIADAIVKVPGVDAVFLDVTDKPPATIEWE